MQCIFLSAAAINICFRNLPSGSCAFRAACLSFIRRLNVRMGNVCLDVGFETVMACSTGCRNGL